MTPPTQGRLLWEGSFCLFSATLPCTQGPMQKMEAHTYRGALFPFAGDSSKPEFQACHLFPLPFFLPVFGALDFLPHSRTWRNRRFVWYSTKTCPPNHCPPPTPGFTGKMREHWGPDGAGQWLTLSTDHVLQGKRLQAQTQPLQRIGGRKHLPWDPGEGPQPTDHRAANTKPGLGGLQGGEKRRPQRGRNAALIPLPGKAAASCALGQLPALSHLFKTSRGIRN